MSSFDWPNINPLQQGIDWLIAEQAELHRLGVQEMEYLREIYSLPLSNEQISFITTKNIANILGRLEGQPLDFQELKAYYLTILKKDQVQLEVMLQNLEHLSESWQLKIQKQLATQPEVVQALLSKLNYIFKLIKASAISALITFEAENLRFNTGLPRTLMVPK